MAQQHLDRATLIVLIHTGKRSLALDEDTYRGLLETITGYASCAAKGMTDRKLMAVLARMRELGFAARPGAVPLAPEHPPQLASPRQIGLVRGLWEAMAKYRIVQDVSDAALNAYCRRMTGANLGQLTYSGCQHVIECLKKWYRRNPDCNVRAVLDRICCGRS